MCENVLSGKDEIPISELEKEVGKLGYKFSRYDNSCIVNLGNRFDYKEMRVWFSDSGIVIEKREHQGVPWETGTKAKGYNNAYYLLLEEIKNL